VEFLIYVVAGTANGCLYALMALALVLIYKTHSFVPFNNGEFFAAGAFIGLLCVKTMALPYPVALAAGTLGGGLVAVICERLTIRPIADSHHLSLVMATAAVSITLQGLARLQWGDDLYTFPTLFGPRSITVLGAPISLQNLSIIALAALLAGGFFLFFGFTALGKKMRALSENPLGAQLIGIHTDRVRDMGAGILMKGFAAAILGGLTSIGGSILGGVLLGITEIFVGAYVSSAVIEVFSFLIIMLVLLVRPAGILGTRTALRV
jgi:branched-chain amino acid transport system permease protein